MPALVTSRREGALLYVALNRPEKRNALHRELLLELVDAIAAAERERDVRAVVVYGDGSESKRFHIRDGIDLRSRASIG